MIALATQDEVQKLWEHIDALSKYLEVVRCPIATTEGIQERYLHAQTKFSTLEGALDDRYQTIH